MDFHNVELRCFAHASEDPDRVRRALGVCMGLDADDIGTGGGAHETQEGEKTGDAGGAGGSVWARVLAARGVTEEYTEGQFHNPIIIITCRLTKRRDTGDFWDRLAGDGLDIAGRLAGEADERTDDEFAFHFRLDKQAAYLGVLRLGNGGDTIAVRAKPRVYAGDRAGLVKAMREFLEGLAVKD